MTSKERSRAEANQANAKLRAELEASEKLVTRLGDLLRRATNAAKGPHPDSLTMHSTHDLPEVVAALAADKRRLDRLQAYGHKRLQECREVRDDLLEALELCLEELDDCGPEFEGTHYCGRCDSAIDRNHEIREKSPMNLKQRGKHDREADTDTV